MIYFEIYFYEKLNVRQICYRVQGRQKIALHNDKISITKDQPHIPHVFPVANCPRLNVALFYIKRQYT